MFTRSGKSNQSSRPTTAAAVAYVVLLNFLLTAPISAQITLQPTQPPMMPVITFWNPQAAISAKGTMICSDHAETGACGTTDADYVGAYTLNMNCASGFYDPIYGGSCWKCPDNDGTGNPWIRGTNAVTDPSACWRVPYESYTSARFDGLGWAWNCSGSQFWDQHDQNGNWIWWGGACWDCPDPNHPRRTQYQVNTSQACATPVNQTAAAEMINYNGCPAPNITTMYPNRTSNDHRMPGQPFLDIASGLSVANNAGGACFACPASDSTGNFLVTERNGNTLIGRKTGNSGCTVDFKYTPPSFPDPGLSNLAGVKDVLFEKQIFIRPDAITKYLYALSQGLGYAINSTAATNWVAQQWADIAAHPYQNANIRALVYLYMTGNAASYLYPNKVIPATRTAAEQILVNSFQNYIVYRRTYLAQQGLNMYDAWKADVDAWNNSHAQSSLSTAFSYGNVPIDFRDTVAALAGGGSLVAGVIGSWAAAETFASGVAEGFVGGTARGTTMFGMQGLQFFQAGLSTVGALSGATIISAVGIILSSIAMSQLMEIETARTNLVNAVTQAQQPINLATLMTQTNGPDLAQFYWTLAMSPANEGTDSQILAMAQAANNIAKQTNYAVPNL